MGLNHEENALSVVSDDGFSMEEYPDIERKHWVDFDDIESFGTCEDVYELLPNDPFGMEFNIGLPNDPFGMDINISLPLDPFGMDFNIEATFEAITDWIEDFEFQACGFESDDASEDENSNDNKLFAELNVFLTGSMRFEQKDVENVLSSAMKSEEGSYIERDVLGDVVEPTLCFGSEKYQNGYEKDYGDIYGCYPADALFFALGYLGVRDLLSVEKVCKPLRDAVQNDPLLWQHIHIDGLLSNKITDEHLVRLTKRARGTLRSLSLVKCSKITNNGLKLVLDSNLGLTKLSVPGCIKLHIKQVLHDLKLFNSVGVPGVKHLRIGGLVGITNQQLKDFKLLLGIDEGKQSDYKPRFYNGDQLYLPLDDKRPVDIEICPRCEQARQVYDCPAASCQVQPRTPQRCRACLICVVRCVKCGCCLETTEYVETFCLDPICMKCLTRLIKAPDKMTFHQKTSYKIIFYG